MGLEIVSVMRKGKKPKHRHVTAVGLIVNNTLIRFSVQTVRKIIKEATVDFYCLDSDGEQVPIRRYTCRCGVKTIRAGVGDAVDGPLSRLPICGETTEVVAMAARIPPTSTTGSAIPKPPSPTTSGRPVVNLPMADVPSQPSPQPSRSRSRTGPGGHGAVANGTRPKAGS
jgi:hypothetical protein